MWGRTGSALAGVDSGSCRRAFVRGTVLGLAVLVVQGTPLAAQRPLTVQGVRSLVFGTLFPGIPKLVLRTDPLNSGQIDVSGAKFTQVQLQFALPAVMSDPGGATLPLSFGSNDGGWSPPQQIGNQIAFDPRAAFVAPLDQNGKVSVYLGGTATPLVSQRAGTYSGTVTLTVTYLP
jgi:uncharacterized protein DUF4402